MDGQRLPPLGIAALAFAVKASIAHGRDSSLEQEQEG